MITHVRVTEKLGDVGEVQLAVGLREGEAGVVFPVELIEFS